MFVHFKHGELKPYTCDNGSIFRMINDMGDPLSSHFSMNVETDQSKLWKTPTYKRGFTEIWNEDDYFRLPTFEVANQQKFQLTETAKQIFLYPSTVPK